MHYEEFSHADSHKQMNRRQTLKGAEALKNAGSVYKRQNVISVIQQISSELH